MKLLFDSLQSFFQYTSSSLKCIKFNWFNYSKISIYYLKYNPREELGIMCIRILKFWIPPKILNSNNKHFQPLPHCLFHASMKNSNIKISLWLPNVDILRKYSDACKCFSWHLTLVKSLNFIWISSSTIAFLCII